MTGDLIPLAQAKRRVRPVGDVLPDFSCPTVVINDNKAHLVVNEWMDTYHLRLLSSFLSKLADRMDGDAA